MTPRQLVTITKMMGLYKISEIECPRHHPNWMVVIFTRGGYANIFEDGRAQHFAPLGSSYGSTHTSPAPF
jgi:hypothetical protein